MATIDVVVNGATQKVPLLTGGRLETANLPVHLPTKDRTWLDYTGKYNTWRTNSSGNEMIVFIRTNGLTNVNAYTSIKIRESASGASYTFDATWDSPPAGTRYLTQTVHVPKGWQYAVSIQGGGTYTVSNIGVWREFS